MSIRQAYMKRPEGVGHRKTEQYAVNAGCTNYDDHQVARFGNALKIVEVNKTSHIEVLER